MPEPAQDGQEEQARDPWDRDPLPTLETSRLTLRRFSMADEAAYAAIWAKPEVVRFFQPGGERSVSEAVKSARIFGRIWTERGATGGIVPFAVVERASARLIGHLGVVIHEHFKLPSLTLFLDSLVWGQGYATEGAAAALAYSFREREFREVIATVATENLASHRVMQKLGFQPMGLHHQWGKVVTLYELTQEQRLSSGGSR